MNDLLYAVLSEESVLFFSILIESAAEFYLSSFCISSLHMSVLICSKTFKCVSIISGLTYNSGHPWKTLRRFTLQALRDFGVGKLTLEERIREEVAVLTSVLREAASSPVRMKPYFLSAATNIICSVMFGARYEIPCFSSH